MRLPRSPAGRLAGVALLVALASLALNVYLLAQLRRPERWALPAFERTLRELAGSDATLRYRIRLPAGTPIRLDIPVNERFGVRVDTTIPIATQAVLPVRSPLGRYDVRVPVRARVPLRATLPLHIRHTFRLRTRTRDEIVVPLEFRLADLPLDALLRP